MSADRIYGLVRRVLRRGIDTSTPSVQVQIESSADELHGDVEVQETYGMTAHPPDDVLEGIGLFIAGESDHGIVIGWMDKLHRPKGLEAGEVEFYAVFGQSLKFDKLGQVVITDATGSKTTLQANGDIVHAPSSQKMKVIGQLEVTKGITAVEGIASQGDIHANGDVTADAISLRHHKTSLVQPGVGTSGDPV
jgi:phage baseplate assembly protein V